MKKIVTAALAAVMATTTLGVASAAEAQSRRDVAGDTGRVLLPALDRGRRIGPAAPFEANLTRERVP